MRNGSSWTRLGMFLKRHVVCIGVLSTKWKFGRAWPGMSVLYKTLSFFGHHKGGLNLVVCEVSWFKVECGMFNVMNYEPWVILNMKISNVVCDMMSNVTFVVYGDWITLIILNRGRTDIRIHDVVCDDVSSANFYVGSSLGVKCWQSNEVMCDLEVMRS